MTEPTVSSADTASRRSVLDAGCGHTDRVSVVLYLCTVSDDTGPLLDHARTYAEARDWVVAATHVDTCAHSIPAAERPEWQNVRALLHAGHLGLVTPGSGHLDSPSLIWLRDHARFVEYSRAPMRPASTR